MFLEYAVRKADELDMLIALICGHHVVYGEEEEANEEERDRLMAEEELGWQVNHHGVGHRGMQGLE